MIFASDALGSVRYRRQATPGGTFGQWQYISSSVRQIAPVVNHDGRVFLFGVRVDRRLCVCSEKTPGGAWNEWSDLAGSIVEIEAGHYQDGRVVVFARGTDNALWERSQNSARTGWNNWVSHGGGMTDRPGLARGQAGHLHAFVRGTGGDLWVRWQEKPPSGPTNKWSGFGGGIFGNPTVAINRVGCLEVFAAGGDGTLWSRYQTAPNNGWAPWGHLQGMALDPVAVYRADRNIALYARDADGQLRLRRQTPSRWLDWAPLGGHLAGPPSPMATQFGVGVAARFVDGTAWLWWGDPPEVPPKAPLTTTAPAQRWRPLPMPPAVEFKQISAGSANRVWALDTAGSNWKWSGTKWEKKGGTVSQISVAADGTMWATNPPDSMRVLRWDAANNKWTWNFPTGVKEVAAVSATQVWGLNNAGELYWLSGSSWQKKAAATKVSQISVGADGVLWGTYAPESGRVLRWDGTKWITGAPEHMVFVTVGDAQKIWALSDLDQVFKWNGSSWVPIPGLMRSIDAASDGSVWGIDLQGVACRWVG